MSHVFLSYARRDHLFAELARMNLSAANISMWRDSTQMTPGADWRQEIEIAISESSAVLVALSEASVASAYVTFEWAYALGKGKAVIPIKLENCPMHPRLETIQYLDFSIPNALPWETLLERIREIEVDKSTTTFDTANTVPNVPKSSSAKAILNYLNQRGYQMASFDRIRKRIDSKLTDKELEDLIAANPTVFRLTFTSDDKKALAKLVP